MVRLRYAERTRCARHRAAGSIAESCVSRLLYVALYYSSTQVFKWVTAVLYKAGGFGVGSV